MNYHSISHAARGRWLLNGVVRGQGFESPRITILNLQAGLHNIAAGRGYFAISAVGAELGGRLLIHSATALTALLSTRFLASGGIWRFPSRLMRA
jgi:hypothetical protein